MKFRKGNEGFCGSRGAEEQRGFAKSEPRVDLNMGGKIIETPKENEGFQVCRGRTLLEDSRNPSLSSTSVWGGKSLKFLRKMKDSGGPGGRCTARTR